MRPERNTDTDTFTFTTGGVATLNLRIDPLEYLRMLDVSATIYNAANTVVASSNLSVNRSAQFTNLSLPAGTYRIVVRGGAEGTPANGFSNYSSLGWFGMKGTLSGGGTSYPVLANGVWTSGQGAAAGAWQHFQFAVPAGKTSVKFELSSPGGDPDLFVKLGSLPSATSYTCKSDSPAATETCTVSAPAAGTYYVGVNTYSAISGVSVKATYAP
ncbi:PPC domain-containing protein [Massilia sp. TSP1-1-2]|uniref:PPC domain-containing protein n=1 Tax=Massilia sp. TSP1-1-2 TaxID=2804649 RepID=UPI003CEFC0EA